MLKDHLDWDELMKAPRCAGGHSSIMHVLFKDAKVIEHYIQDDYQGDEAFIYFLNDEYILVTDYFGSCSGCDAWEDATNEEVETLCTQLANNAHRFDTIGELIHFLDFTVNEDSAAYYAERSTSIPLSKKLKENIVLMRDINIDNLLN